jgi:endoribonuclease Dicer
MDMFCGDMGCDLWSMERWIHHFEKNMVIVCTAEVLRQCLHHSFISMDRINLLIFDEAHHAKKDHSYARIIKDFYASEDKALTLPKIFGMTASPVDTRVNVKRAAAELEALLHCEIATAKPGALNGYQITPKQEQLAKYSTLGGNFETVLYQKMYERLHKIPVFKKALLYSLQATKELGAWCSDQVWRFCLSDEEVKKQLANTERQYYSQKSVEPLEVLETRKVRIQEAQDIVKAWDFEQPHFEAPGSSKNLSPKVVLLVQYLKERFERSTDDKVIVFVRQRYTARLLAKLFSYSDIGTSYLHVGTLVCGPYHFGLIKLELI